MSCARPVEQREQSLSACKFCSTALWPEKSWQSGWQPGGMSAEVSLQYFCSTVLLLDCPLQPHKACSSHHTLAPRLSLGAVKSACTAHHSCPPPQKVTPSLTRTSLLRPLHPAAARSSQEHSLVKENKHQLQATSTPDAREKRRQQLAASSAARHTRCPPCRGGTCSPCPLQPVLLTDSRPSVCWCCYATSGTPAAICTAYLAKLVRMVKSQIHKALDHAQPLQR